MHSVQDVHRLGCRALAVDPLNRFLVTGGADCLVKLWEISPVSSLLVCAPDLSLVAASSCTPAQPLSVAVPSFSCRDGISQCSSRANAHLEALPSSGCLCVLFQLWLPTGQSLPQHNHNQAVNATRDVWLSPTSALCCSHAGWHQAGKPPGLHRAPRRCSGCHLLRGSHHQRRRSRPVHGEPFFAVVPFLCILIFLRAGGGVLVLRHLLGVGTTSGCGDAFCVMPTVEICSAWAG